VLWSVEGERLNEIWKPADRVIFHPDGQRIISQYHSAFSVWDVSTGRILREFRLPEHGSRMLDFAYSSDGDNVATASSDDILRIWDVETGELQTVFKVANRLYRMAMHPKLDLLAYVSCSSYHRTGACSAQRVILWDFKKKQIVREYDHSTASRIAFHPRGQGLVINESWQVVARQYDIQSDEIWDSDQDCNDFIFSPDGRMVAVHCTVSSSHKIHLFDTVNGDHLRTFENTYFASAISPDGEFFISSSHNTNVIQIWDVHNDSVNAPLFELRTQGESVQSVAFGIDGRVLVAIVRDSDGASGLESGMSSWLEIWDVAEGKHLRTIEVEARDISMSPDGKFLALAHDDDTVTLWGIK
jgi:WD40 repeat protein